MQTNSQDQSEAPFGQSQVPGGEGQTPGEGLNLPEDIENMSIQDALTYQKTTGMNIEAFINNVANKMKFKVRQQ